MVELVARSVVAMGDAITGCAVWQVTSTFTLNMFLFQFDTLIEKGHKQPYVRVCVCASVCTAAGAICMQRDDCKGS